MEVQTLCTSMTEVQALKLLINTQPAMRVSFLSELDIYSMDREMGTIKHNYCGCLDKGIGGG